MGNSISPSGNPIDAKITDKTPEQPPLSPPPGPGTETPPPTPPPDSETDWVNMTDQQVNDVFNGIFGLYGNSIAVSPAILEKQQDFNKMIDAENQLIDEKKKGIHEMVASQSRMVDLNNSYQKRLNQWSYVAIMLIVLIIALNIFLYIAELFPELSGIIDFILAAVLGLFIIYFYILIKDIRSRKNVNFDEVIVGAPTGAGKPQSNSAAITGNISAGSSGVGSSCVAQDCCIPGQTIWDENFNKCINLACIRNGQLVDTSGNCLSQQACLSNPGMQICGNTCVSAATVCNSASTTTTTTTPTESFINGTVRLNYAESYSTPPTALYTQKTR